MSDICVAYWSGTGNTEAMANAVAEGVTEKGAEASTFTASDFVGYNPETSANGVIAWQYPATCTFIGGIQLTF